LSVNFAACLSSTSILSIDERVSRLPLPLMVRYRLSVYLTSSAVSSRRSTGGLGCQRTPFLSLEDKCGVVGLGPGLGEVRLQQIGHRLHQRARLHFHETAVGPEGWLPERKDTSPAEQTTECVRLSADREDREAGPSSVCTDIVLAYICTDGEVDGGGTRWTVRAPWSGRTTGST
jgi:hypothetical protein